MESLCERTELHKVYSNVLPQMWQRICEQWAIFGFSLFGFLSSITFRYKVPVDISKCVGCPLRNLSRETMQIPAFVAPSERYLWTEKRADSLDTTLFSPISWGRHYAGFLVAIETPGICVNFALISKMMLFGIISELIYRIIWSLTLFYPMYLWKFTATFMLNSRKETRSSESVGSKILGLSSIFNWARLKTTEELFFCTFL